MFGIFSIFGRSQDQQLLDKTLRDAGVHPKLVPDAVKIVMVRQIKEAVPPGHPDAVRARFSELLAYCYLGPADFSDIHGPDLAGAVEQRMDKALDEGDNLDAKLILLFMHAGLVDESVTDRYTLAHDE